MAGKKHKPISERNPAQLMASEGRGKEKSRPRIPEGWGHRKYRRTGCGWAFYDESPITDREMGDESREPAAPWGCEYRWVEPRGWALFSKFAPIPYSPISRFSNLRHVRAPDSILRPRYHRPAISRFSRRPAPPADLPLSHPFELLETAERAMAGEDVRRCTNDPVAVRYARAQAQDDRRVRDPGEQDFDPSYAAEMTDAEFARPETAFDDELFGQRTGQWDTTEVQEVARYDARNLTRVPDHLRRSKWHNVRLKSGRIKTLEVALAFGPTTVWSRSYEANSGGRSIFAASSPLYDKYRNPDGTLPPFVVVNGVEKHFPADGTVMAGDGPAVWHWKAVGRCEVHAKPGPKPKNPVVAAGPRLFLPEVWFDESHPHHDSHVEFLKMIDRLSGFFDSSVEAGPNKAVQIVRAEGLARDAERKAVRAEYGARKPTVDQLFDGEIPADNEEAPAERTPDQETPDREMLTAEQLFDEDASPRRDAREVLTEMFDEGDVRP